MRQNLQNFKNVRVLVLGDVMLDQYLFGKTERISPEAPVPVVRLFERKFVPGGAGNVAANIKGLGAQVYLFGIVGRDENAENLKKSLEEKSVRTDFLQISPERQTTVKTRVIAESQQICRVDVEDEFDLSSNEEEKIWSGIEEVFEDTDIFVVSDYAKGLITENMITRLITKVNSNGGKILVDPKGKNYLKYKNASIITPNYKESVEAIEYLSRQMKKDVNLENFAGMLGLEAFLVTEGERGMTLFENSKTHKLEATARNVFDVTGAGDTVIAVLAVAAGAGMSFLESAKLANFAAGLSVEQIGTSIVPIEELEKLYFK